MVTLKPHFFVFNPKSYLYGNTLLALAKTADQAAKDFPEISVIVTCPYADLSHIASNTTHIIVSAQHLDGIEPGRGMGAVLPESLANAGAKATFLNHAEHPLTLSALTKAVDRAKKLQLLTIVCADSLTEAVAITSLKPDILLCEPTELIGTGQTSDEHYMTQTNTTIKQLAPSIKMMQGAGISSPEDVYHAILLGADGTGCTSGITQAEDPHQMLYQMVAAVAKAAREVN